MQDKSKQPGADSQSANLNWLRIIPEAWVISMHVFLRRTMGERYLGLQAGAVILLIPIYCTVWPHADQRPMMIFLLAYLFMCIVARLDMLRRRVRGETPQHSRYPGYPRLMKVFPFLSEISVKRFIEPLLAFFCGTFMLPLNQPLGLYWMIGAVCMFATMNSAVEWDRRRSADMFDSVMDQQDLAERFRKMRGDDF